MRKAGLTYKEIGEAFGLSKQRIYQIETGKVTSGESAKRAKKKWHRQNILMINGKSVRVRKRKRPNDTCEICGRVVNRLDYHHWDNNRPELGIWVCRSCHRGCGFSDKGLHNKYIELREYIDKRLAR